MKSTPLARAVIAAGATVLATVGSAVTADAAVLVQASNNVTEIKELDIGGTLYNVAFTQAHFTSAFGPGGNSPTPTFWQG